MAPASEQRPAPVTINRVVAAGRAAVDARARAYGEVGAGEQVSVARNRAAFGRIAFRPRVLRDVGEVDTSTTFLGRRLASPVMLAPVGSIALYDAGGAASAARAATRAGTLATVGILSEPGYEEVVAAAGPQVLQVYVGGDRGWIGDLLDWVAEVGCSAICLTADSPVPGRRDALLEAGIRWRMERTGVPPDLRRLGRDRAYQARFTWDDLTWLLGRTDLPVVLKGVMHEDDAGRAADLGVAGVHVSNHGGRELDHQLSPLEVLPAIVEAVADRAEVVVDSGFLRGTDICKGLALGARAVLIGRLQCWALAAGGEATLVQVLDLLRDEVATTMAQLGVTSVDGLAPHHLAPTFAV